jgi:hypothetical protein
MDPLLPIQEPQQENQWWLVEGVKEAGIQQLKVNGAFRSSYRVWGRVQGEYGQHSW